MVKNVISIRPWTFPLDKDENPHPCIFHFLKVDGASDSLLPHREAGSLAHMSATSTSCLNNRPSVVSRKPRLFCETHPLESRPLSHVAHIVYPTREHLRCLGQ